MSYKMFYKGHQLVDGTSKGAFEDPADLSSAFPDASAGDFAIVTSENAIYIWDVTKKEWVNANAKVDLSEYFTKEEMRQLLNEKQDNIVEKEVSGSGGEQPTDYFYAGDKTWASILSKIRGCALTGLVTNDSSQVEAADSLLVATGKLQAQINGFIHPIIGDSEPTTSTPGVVGQDYINTSNGDKYRMVSVNGSIYKWKKYGTASVENFSASISNSNWISSGTTGVTIKYSVGKEDGCFYIVGPSPESRSQCEEISVYVDGNISNGNIIFHATEAPKGTLNIYFCKINGGTGTSRVYSAFPSSGASKDAMTIPGGASISVSESLGEPPYDIQFNDSSITVNGKEIAAKGADGKSAYQYAVDGGYTGTEEEFQALVGTGPWLPLSGGNMSGGIGLKLGAGISLCGSNGIHSSTDATINMINIPRRKEPGGEVYSSTTTPFNFHSGDCAVFDCPINLSGSKIEYIGTPTLDYEAANKKYVDQSIQQAILDSWAKSY